MPSGWDDQVSSLVVEQVRASSSEETPVTIYKDPNFRGDKKGFQVGSYEIHQLGIGNDQLSSLKVKPGYRVKLYKHARFQGDTVDFTTDQGKMPSGWNDQTSSLVVEKI